MPLELKDGYFTHPLDHHFTSKSMPYALYMPLAKGRYSDIKSEFRNAKKDINWSVGMIEAPKMFGLGWIGLEEKNGDKYVSGEFIGYKIVGDYAQFRYVWKKIMTDYPKISEAYHLYMTDPDVTAMEENITYIIFR
jgi:hypothetical protein